MSAIAPPPSRVWWKQPLDRVEGTWIVIAFVWCMIMFFMMPYWHVYGKQNLANEAYRTTPEMFTAKTQAMIDKYKVREETEQKIPVVHPPRGQRRLPDRAAVAVVPDARARGRQDVPAAPRVDGLAARLLAAAREHQHRGASRTTSTWSR